MIKNVMVLPIINLIKMFTNPINRCVRKIMKMNCFGVFMKVDFDKEKMNE